MDLADQLLGVDERLKMAIRISTSIGVFDRFRWSCRPPIRYRSLT